MPTTELKSIIDPQKTYTIESEVMGRGAKKSVFFSTNKDFVIGIYHNKPDQVFMERLKDLVGKYYKDLFQHEGAEVWEKKFCWPYDIVSTPKGNIGIVMPLYSQDFFFSEGFLKGKEKKGSFFTKPLTRRAVDRNELGDWRGMLLCAYDLARTIRRIHAAGLCHSDLSYNNVLINPSKGSALVIDVDELVVPGKYPPGVLGSPGFIAPEVIVDRQTLPSQSTDLYALGCLVYLYLLRRHPLQGKKVFDTDPEKDELIQMGSGALFVEDSTDDSNRPVKEGYKPLDWSDVDRLPYQITGPYLSPLIKRTFEEGLKDPSKRPSASEWETALWSTYERLTPCSNPNCTEHYFVLNKSMTCPFCGQKLTHTVPIFDIYIKDYKNRSWKFWGKQFYGTDKKSFHKWHFFDNIYYSEKIRKEDIATVGNVWQENGSWYFYNKALDKLTLVFDGQERNLPIGESVPLKTGLELRNNAEHGLMLKIKLKN